MGRQIRAQTDIEAGGEVNTGGITVADRERFGLLDGEIAATYHIQQLHRSAQAAGGSPSRVPVYYLIIHNAGRFKKLPSEKLLKLQLHSKSTGAVNIKRVKARPDAPAVGDGP